jgi:ABC-type molybdenum transport system ATPase subunit/photorepair protein PhrA
MKGAYLSARYESRKEETDFSLSDFLLGNTELNADEQLQRHPDQALLERVMDDLKLEPLKDMPVTHLSNGQTRRARIAKALLAKPEVLLLDGPFSESVNSLLHTEALTLNKWDSILRHCSSCRAYSTAWQKHKRLASSSR